MDTLKGELYLATGETVQFAVHEPAAVKTLVAQVMSGKAWMKPSLVIAEARHLTAVASAQIVRADLHAHPDVETVWEQIAQSDLERISQTIHHSQPERFTRYEITATAYAEGAARMEAAMLSRAEVLGAPGQPIEVFGRLSLRGGAIVYHHYTLPTPGTYEQRQFLAHVFENSSTPFRAHHGGVAVLNPSAIVTATFYPGATPSSDTWVVDSVEVTHPAT